MGMCIHRYIERDREGTDTDINIDPINSVSLENPFLTYRLTLSST